MSVARAVTYVLDHQLAPRNCLELGKPAKYMFVSDTSGLFNSGANLRHAELMGDHASMLRENEENMITGGRLKPFIHITIDFDALTTMLSR